MARMEIDVTEKWRILKRKQMKQWHLGVAYSFITSSFLQVQNMFPALEKFSFQYMHVQSYSQELVYPSSLFLIFACPPIRLPSISEPIFLQGDNTSRPLHAQPNVTHQKLENHPYSPTC